MLAQLINGNGMVSANTCMLHCPIKMYDMKWLQWNAIYLSFNPPLLFFSYFNFPFLFFCISFSIYFQCVPSLEGVVWPLSIKGYLRGWSRMTCYLLKCYLSFNEHFFFSYFHFLFFYQYESKQTNMTCKWWSPSKGTWKNPHCWKNLSVAPIVTMNSHLKCEV